MTWGGEHTMQYRDDVLQNSTCETYIILLTSVTPISSIKNLRNTAGTVDVDYHYLQVM